MKTVSQFFLLFFALGSTAFAGDDLMDVTRQDPGIAMIRFPQSLTLIQAPGEGKSLDPEISRKVLRKIDPARIVPVKMGKEVKGALDRSTLKVVGEEYGTDLLLLFRAGENSRLKGLVYFVQQKKILPLPAIDSATTGNDEEVRASLKKLAQAARKAILSFKFEKRRSSY